MRLEDYLVDVKPSEGLFYTHDASVFDDFGLLNLRCHRCGQLIGGRTYVGLRSRIDPLKTEKAMVFIHYANYCEKEVVLSNNSIMRIPHCVDCGNLELDTVKVIDQVKRSWMKENIIAGHSEQRLLDHADRVEELSITKNTGKVHISWKPRRTNAGR